jgi:membrane protease YdiL (CAAX protease family)
MSKLYLSILLAFALWIIMFVLRPLNFWLMLSFSTSLLGSIALSQARPLLRKKELNLRNVLLGFLMAGLLYAIFWLGNRLLILVSALFPVLLPDRSGNIASVYANLGSLPPALVGALLFFPIGFGEELFWRGFVQRRLAEAWNPAAGFAVTLLLYTGVHLPTGNPVLILAAFACGAFWGGLYWLTGRLFPVLVSHMLWDPAIFVIWPIR